MKLITIIAGVMLAVAGAFATVTLGYDLYLTYKEQTKQAQVEQPKKEAVTPEPQTIYITNGKAELVKSLYIENLLCATAGYGSPQKMKTFKDRVLKLVMVKEDMTEYTYTPAWFDAFENKVSNKISNQSQEEQEQMLAELPIYCKVAPARLKNILDGLPVLTKDEIKKVYDLERQQTKN